MSEKAKRKQCAHDSPDTAHDNLLPLQFKHDLPISFPYFVTPKKKKVIIQDW